MCVFPIGPLSCSEGFTELGYYNGSVSQTDSGSSCLKWTDFPDYVLQYPDRGLGDHNHCRNPDRESNPWCFFRQKSGAIGWAYCDCHQGELFLLFFSLTKALSAFKCFWVTKVLKVFRTMCHAQDPGKDASATVTHSHLAHAYIEKQWKSTFCVNTTSVSK